ncbi:hypothetical protein EW146_g2455 [Bondarzewia mesenterica]|uniref:Yeast cell wall synthesis Kre9/Knh1-like N-terminal domain-containing protein n=1 Tax=Bondarzewia mesenterica TaxID=1095465 RepID=A0A4S4M122_9AGAM|nr:hypothetical protein EW146_g2455 [Bondarzewia mesenterica]
MRVVLAILSLVASTFAYQINRPNDEEGWKSHGPISIAWDRVDTDPEYFTIVLYNDARSFPHHARNRSLTYRLLHIQKRQTLQTLAPRVDGKMKKIVIYPTGSLPVGEGFQVNFVKDPDHVHTILAQSKRFKIEPSKEHNYKRLLGSLPGVGALGSLVPV